MAIRFTVKEKQRDASPMPAPGRVWSRAPNQSSASVTELVFVVMPSETPATEKRPYPDYMYVDVLTLTKVVSVFVFGLCIFSLIVSLLTGFTLIARLFSVLFAFFAGGFYLMTISLARRHSNHEKS